MLCAGPVLVVIDDWADVVVDEAEDRLAGHLGANCWGESGLSCAESCSREYPEAELPVFDMSGADDWALGFSAAVGAFELSGTKMPW